MRLRSTGIAIGIAVLLGSVLANPVQAAVSAATNPAASAGTAPAASNPYSPAYQHPYREGAVPTLAAKTQMDGYAAAHPAAKTPTPSAVNNQLSYRGGFAGTGAFTGSVKVYLIFWGSQWGTVGTSSGGYTTLSGDPSGEAVYLQALMAGLGTGGETWSGVETQYCAGLANGLQSCPSNFPHVVYPTGGALGGVWVDESAAAPSNATFSQLSAEAEAGASHFGNTTVAANTNAQYVVLSPTGTHPDGFNTSTGNFCAWHSYVSTSSYGDVAFHNMPYVTDMGTGCGENYVNSGAAGLLDGVTMVEGHEYAETLTDRSIAGWGDANGNEIGDKCVWNGTGAGGAADLSLTTGSFAMQSMWANDASGGTGGCQFTHPIVTSSSNLALNQPVTASSSLSGYPASNATDGNTASYWESQDGAGYPQTLTVDLGAATEVGQVVLTLPSSWGSRTQTLSVSTSSDGTNYYTSVASAGYTFSPTSNNTVTIPVPDSWARYVRLTVTANTGWSAAQISEFRVYPPTPLATGSAAVLQLSTSNDQTTIGVVGTTSAGPTYTLHNPSTAAVALASITSTTGFGQTSTCGNSLGAGGSCTISTTFTPPTTGMQYNTIVITANGGPYLASTSGVGVTNLALNKTATVSSTNSTYVAGNMVDGNTSTYWESTNAWPQTASVDLGTSTNYGGTYTIASLGLTLPPSWGSRTETLSIDVSSDNVNFTQVVFPATYTFNPTTGNTVTIRLSANNVRAVRLDFTANSGWPAAQLSEFEIYGY